MTTQPITTIARTLEESAQHYWAEYFYALARKHMTRHRRVKDQWEQIAAEHFAAVKALAPLYRTLCDAPDDARIMHHCHILGYQEYRATYPDHMRF